MYYSLPIRENGFSSYRNGIAFLGTPHANLAGTFVSNTLAKSTFNGIEWSSTPVMNRKK